MRASRPRFTSVSLLLGTVAFSLALAPMIALRYGYDVLSRSVSGAGFLILLALAGCLWACGRRAVPTRVRRSAAAGLLLGVLWVIEIGINNVLAPPLPGRDILDDVFWAVIALGILLVAGVAAYGAGRLRAGVEAGAWAAWPAGPSPASQRCR
ncbi:MAG: hypothetical protein JO250_05265 [Armatimonadetes bacterium]|nr:hypothetical protein [Armatimonadota bacterium]